MQVLTKLLNKIDRASTLQLQHAGCSNDPNTYTQVCEDTVAPTYARSV